MTKVFCDRCGREITYEKDWADYMRSSSRKTGLRLKVDRLGWGERGEPIDLCRDCAPVFWAALRTEADHDHT